MLQLDGLVTEPETKNPHDFSVLRASWSTPKGSRTPVCRLRICCPRPLDDGGVCDTALPPRNAGYYGRDMRSSSGGGDVSGGGGFGGGICLQKRMLLGLLALDNQRGLDEKQDG